MNRARAATAAVALSTALTLVGCSETPDPTPVESLPAAFDDGVPAPAGEVVLTLETDDATVEWDLATLEELPLHELELFEPFVEEDLRFTGPLWIDVLRASGVELEEGRAVELVALDEYVSVVPADLDALEGVMLATREEGEAIPLERGGPIRLVYPPDNETGKNLNAWIWSIVSGEVE